MNPVTVLHETMRAAGDSRLTKWHAALVESGNVTASYDDDIAKDIASRDQLQRQVDELAPDVENYEARTELENQVSSRFARQQLTVSKPKSKHSSLVSSSGRRSSSQLRRSGN